jgi:hypothetical protein
MRTQEYPLLEVILEGSEEGHESVEPVQEKGCCKHMESIMVGLNIAGLVAACIILLVLFLKVCDVF